MNHSTVEKQDKVASWFRNLVVRKPDHILEYIDAQPFMDHSIPFPIIPRVARNIPPICIKLPVTEVKNLCEHIQPGVKKSEEH
jgi:hypothetical protein